MFIYKWERERRGQRGRGREHAQKKLISMMLLNLNFSFQNCRKNYFSPEPNQSLEFAVVTHVHQISHGDGQQQPYVWLFGSRNPNVAGSELRVCTCWLIWLLSPSWGSLPSIHSWTLLLTNSHTRYYNLNQSQQEVTKERASFCECTHALITAKYSNKCFKGQQEANSLQGKVIT